MSCSNLLFGAPRLTECVGPLRARSTIRYTVDEDFRDPHFLIGVPLATRGPPPLRPREDRPFGRIGLFHVRRSVEPLVSDGIIVRGQEVQVGVGEVGDREDVQSPAGVKAGQEKDVADLLREPVVESEKGLRACGPIGSGLGLVRTGCAGVHAPLDSSRRTQGRGRAGTARRARSLLPGSLTRQLPRCASWQR